MAHHALTSIPFPPFLPPGELDNNAIKVYHIHVISTLSRRVLEGTKIAGSISSRRYGISIWTTQLTQK
jgi:hypothetical protein